MKINHQKDFWSGVLFLLVGAGFAVGALSYSFGSSARPGPAYFPFGLGILTALLGVFEIVKALLSRSGGGDIGPWPLKQMAIILFGVVLFGLMLPRLGLIVALPVLVFVASIPSGEFKVLEVIINCVVLTVFSWLVFVKGLGLTIPMLPTFITG
ncbi:MAG: tripartite tricarboxylate transporter TctB family protein [Rubrivivax sp.]|nr:tripartite tricarboxylate transporter TctB family protein [Rubrivivax sp.]